MQDMAFKTQDFHLCTIPGPPSHAHMDKQQKPPKEFAVQLILRNKTQFKSQSLNNRYHHIR